MNTDLPGPADLVGNLEFLGKLGAGRERIRQAFLDVPRHMFAPDTWWERQYDRTYLPMSRAETGETAWRRELYDDNAVMVTQVDNGRRAAPGAVGRASSSSLSAPGIVADMLHLAAISPGDRVLELGAGQGFSAALAAHLAHPRGHVTGVEYDPELAGIARANIASAGIANVEIVTGDGRLGHPGAAAPFDAVIATCTFDPIPTAWLEQAAPDARIVATQQSRFYPYGLFSGTVTADGTAITGGFIDDANFMWDRGAARLTGDPTHLFTGQEQADRTITDVSPEAVVDGDGAQFAIGRLIPDLYQWIGRNADPDHADDYTLWLYDEHGSWAAVDYTPSAQRFSVSQFGPRRLWTEAEAAHAWWTSAGSPDIDRFGLVVTRGGQHLTLDGRSVEGC
jgi:protein-L-isoaspartate O-methyltransferase